MRNGPIQNTFGLEFCINNINFVEIKLLFGQIHNCLILKIKIYI